MFSVKALEVLVFNSKILALTVISYWSVTTGLKCEKMLRVEGRENPLFLVFILQISILKVKNITLDFCALFHYGEVSSLGFFAFHMSGQGLSNWNILFQICLSFLQAVCINVYMHVVWKVNIQMVFWIKTVTKVSCIKLEFLSWFFSLLSISSSIRWQCCEYAGYQCWNIESKASIFKTSQMLFHYISYEFQEEEGELEMIDGNYRYKNLHLVCRNLASRKVAFSPLCV